MSASKNRPPAAPKELLYALIAHTTTGGSPIQSDQLVDANTALSNFMSEASMEYNLNFNTTNIDSSNSNNQRASPIYRSNSIGSSAEAEISSSDHKLLTASAVSDHDPPQLSQDISHDETSSTHSGHSLSRTSLAHSNSLERLQEHFHQQSEHEQLHDRDQATARLLGEPSLGLGLGTLHIHSGRSESEEEEELQLLDGYAATRARSKSKSKVNSTRNKIRIPTSLPNSLMGNVGQPNLAPLPHSPMHPQLLPRLVALPLRDIRTCQHYIVRESARPPIPLRCPAPLVRLLELCWADDPDDRPHFDMIVDFLEKLIHDIKEEEKETQRGGQRHRASMLGLLGLPLPLPLPTLDFPNTFPPFPSDTL